ncbi:MAG TPA: RNA-guided pseudouridylation complex pseudouridine synthase subunit Cbf5, partial [Nitrososphaera sp.]|nr:RNA-guided pseudouridylation complex pseudouridine synthase subunit Cbf5 [Nitrososphaera sp.]
MTLNLPQLENLERVDDDVTNDNYGHYPDKRPIASLLDYGMILVDKPAGPASHEVVAWVKRILEIEKAGHSGTLDPGATGMLPMGLGEGTKALSVLLLGPKEYYALARLHAHASREKVSGLMREFTGEIYQRPPQRSSVKRVTRVRTVYEFDYLEDYDRLVLMRILCQAGTYIRKIIYDIGEILSPGATMVELRRTRVSNFSEQSDGLVRLHDLADAFYRYKQNKDDDEKLRRLIKPIEHCLEGIRGITIRDTAVDAICHGAPL